MEDRLVQIEIYLKAILANQATMIQWLAGNEVDNGMLTEVQVAAMRLSSMAIVAAQPDAVDAVIAEMEPIKTAIAKPWRPGVEYIPPCIVEHEGAYFAVMQHVEQSLEHQPPGSAGMLAIYRPFDSEQHAGTIDDPIPWIGGMNCYKGKYYSYEGKVYQLVGTDLLPSLEHHYPGAPGVHCWQLVTT